MKKTTPYIIQFSCILALLTAILLQGLTKTVKMKPLQGFVDELDSVALSFSTYRDGTYQEYLTDLSKQNTGFREFFIRNYNQVAYSCFERITNNNIVKGAGQELFLTMYINEVTGKQLENQYSTIENAKIEAQKNVEETLRFIDTLHQHHTEFLFVFAPSKTAVYPEKIPKRYKEQITDFSLEEYYIELFKENDIPHIDFYNYFKAIKDTISYPLYSPMASHWAESTIHFVADSILRKLESITGYKLPSIQVVDENITSDYTEYDGELERNLNLLFPLPRPAMPRPILELSDTANKDHPNLLVVGDSYFDQLMFSCFKKAFNCWDFWEYNRYVYSNREYYREPIDSVIDIPHTLQQADILMVISTSPMIYNYMFGFPSKAYDMYKVDETEAEVLKTMEIIRRNDAWYEGVVEQSERLGLTIEEGLRLNANYFIEAHKNKNTQ